MEEIRNIVLMHRRCGNSDWLLNAAIDNPKCVIITKTMDQAKLLQKRYVELYKTRPWYMRFLWTIVGRKNPMIMPTVYAERSLRGIDRPVIFDNCALT